MIQINSNEMQKRLQTHFEIVCFSKVARTYF